MGVLAGRSWALGVVAGASMAAAAVTFTVNASAPRLALNFAELQCVGSGHGALALRADYREHLARVQRDIGFKFIRGHGILDDDMSTYLPGPSAHGANLMNVFSVYDFYLEVGLRPIVELSFMPEQLASDPSRTIMHYKGGTSPPRDPAQWAAFITEMFGQLAARYGVEELRTWPVEVCESRRHGV
jgi:xylan 1,4-beta-xylosidase